MEFLQHGINKKSGVADASLKHSVLIDLETKVFVQQSFQPGRNYYLELII